MKRIYRYAMWGLFALALLAGDSYGTWRVAERHFARTVVSASSSSVKSADPIADFVLEREQLRARQTAQLNDIIYAEGVDEGTAARARARLLDMMDSMNAETTLEGVLRSRGFEGAAVTVNSRSANVIVRAEALTQRETAVILELVMRETGLTGGNVKIIPVK